MRLSSFISFALLCGVASAIPTTRTLAARDCSAEVAHYNKARLEARGHSKRTHYAKMLNTTCLLSPDAGTARVNYVANPPVRTDLRESQVGVYYLVDVGVMDVTTCKPLPNVMVELWSPNAQGNYGTTFLRGATSTASNGIAEFETIFPGYSSDGANHLNILVHTGNSESSGTTHAGQLFFSDFRTDIVSMYAPLGYDKNTHTRIKNAQDPNFIAANQNGYNAVLHEDWIGDDWPAGMIGYITVGVNPTHLI
ncbi:aromatic compound dioxygenase [Mycena rebaudengoi]|nr:aromatic compound dioxygenase [Mycena rebaudengoi]